MNKPYEFTVGYFEDIINVCNNCIRYAGILENEPYVKEKLSMRIDQIREILNDVELLIKKESSNNDGAPREYSKPKINPDTKQNCCSRRM